MMANYKNSTRHGNKISNETPNMKPSLGQAGTHNGENNSSRDF